MQNTILAKDFIIYYKIYLALIACVKLKLKTKQAYKLSMLYESLLKNT